MLYLLISPIHSVYLLEKTNHQLVQPHVFLRSIFKLIKINKRGYAFSHSRGQEGGDFCINEKLEKWGRVRHLNLGFFKYD